MDEPKVEVEVEVEPEPATEPDTTAEIDAAAAAASAEAAEEAARLAIVQAEAQTAEVATLAAAQIGSYQERLEQCEVSQQETRSLVESYREQLTALAAQNELILSRLPPKPEPEQSPADPPPNENTEVHETRQEPTEKPEPAEEPPKPERRRAHRWI